MVKPEVVVSTKPEVGYIHIPLIPFTILGYAWFKGLSACSAKYLLWVARREV